MDHPYIPILFLFVIGGVFAAAFLAISAILGRKKPSESKLAPYECGHEPVGSARQRVNIKFSLVAMLFIVFDLETIFLVPWAIIYKDWLAQGSGAYLLATMGIFLFILVVGLAYEWRRKAMDWR